MDTVDRPLPRRRVLAGLLLLAPGLAACSAGSPATPAQPDPLIALAAAARADAALAAAVAATAPELADQLQPLVEARTEHAAALAAEIARLEPARASTTPVSSVAVTAPTDAAETLVQVRAAVQASGRAAAAAVLDLPADRVGLVASVAACCATYAAVLR